MRKCPLCQQLYDDETNFCLTDGSTLAPVSGSYTSESEMPTVVHPASAPTVYNQAQSPSPAYGNAPFIPPVSPAPAAASKSGTLLIAALVGLIALALGGGAVGLVMYGVFKTDQKEPVNAAVNSNTADKSTPKPSPEQKSDADELRQQQEKLDKDRQKLEEERKRLEAQKKQQQTQKNPDVSTATIIDPPSNIRETPNGRVLCVARTRGTVINITGGTGVYDNNGTWYYTDYCGRQGVIHSSQIR